MKGERNLKFKSGKWIADISFKKPDGKYKRFIRLFETKEAAQAFIGRQRERKHLIKFGVERPDEEKAGVTFSEFAEKFIAIHKKEDIRPKTQASHETSRAALARVFGDRLLSEIAPEMIAEYKAERGEKLKPTSVNREISFLKMMMARAVEWGYLDRNPAAGLEKFSEPETKIRILTDDQARALIEAAGEQRHVPDLQAIIRLLLMTGMRKKETLELKWEYPEWETQEEMSSIVDFKRGEIFIPAGLAKNHKERRIPMNAAVSEMLQGIRRASRGARVFKVREFKGSFRKASKKAKIRNLRIHDLRHTAASRMIEAGVDVVSVSKILGHSDLKITMRYCHPSRDTMRQAVEKLAEIYSPTRKKLESVKIPKPVSSSILYN